jgi:hypothetical protein
VTGRGKQHRLHPHARLRHRWIVDETATVGDDADHPRRRRRGTLRALRASHNAIHWLIRSQSMRFHRFVLLFVGASTALATGCAPLSVPAPFHFAETPKALAPGAVRITAAGGGGAAGLDGAGGGGGLRVRVGVGGHQEIGAEGTVLAVDTGTRQKTDPYWVGQSMAYSYKLSWKLSPRDWVAVLAGVGGAHSILDESLGADVAVLFARPNGYLRPYGGLRALFAAPVGRPTDDRGGLTAGLTAAGGLSLHFSPRVDCFFEGGFLWITSTGLHDPGPATSTNTDEMMSHVGGYGLFALAIALGHVDQ